MTIVVKFFVVALSHCAESLLIIDIWKHIGAEDHVNGVPRGSWRPYYQPIN